MMFPELLLLIGLSTSPGLGYEPLGVLGTVKGKLHPVEVIATYDTGDKNSSGKGWNFDVSTRFHFHKALVGYQYAKWSDGYWRKRSHSLVMGYEPNSSVTIISTLTGDRQSIGLELTPWRFLVKADFVRFEQAKVKHGGSFSLSFRVK